MQTRCLERFSREPKKEVIPFGSRSCESRMRRLRTVHGLSTSQQSSMITSVQRHAAPLAARPRFALFWLLLVCTCVRYVFRSPSDSGSIFQHASHAPQTCFKATRNGGRSSSSDNRSTLLRRWRTLTRGGSSRDLGTWAQVRTSHAPDEGSHWGDEGRCNEAHSRRRVRTCPCTPELHPVEDELLNQMLIRS